MELLLNNLVENFLKEKLTTKDSLNQSLLFWGESDLGKLTTAKIFAKSLLCENKTWGGCNSCSSCTSFDKSWHPDYLLIDSNGDSIKVDDALPIFDFLLYKPQLSQKRILIINDCEKLNLTVQSSLLKMLEEPKNHFLIILISTNPHKLLKTIKSRVIPLRFTKPNKSELINFIRLNHPTKIKDLDYLINLSQNHTAKTIDYLNDSNSLKAREENIKLFEKIMKNNFIEQSNIVKKLISEFEAKEKDLPNENTGIKTFLKTVINDWLNYLETDLISSIQKKDQDIKIKAKYLKNSLQLLSYVDNYNANYRLLLEMFCLTTF